MTYFIHKHGSGISPQSGYHRVGRYRNEGGDIWVLWSTELTAEKIRAQVTGILKVIGDDLDSEVLALYPEMLAQKRSRIRAVGATHLTAIAGEYMTEERETWSEQKSQAEAYLADNSADVPMLAAFAEARGVPVGLLAQGIMDNNALFQLASGQTMGQMYALLDQVSYAAENIDLNTALNIDWS